MNSCYHYLINHYSVSVCLSVCLCCVCMYVYLYCNLTLKISLMVREGDLVLAHMLTSFMQCMIFHCLNNSGLLARTKMATLALYTRLANQVLYASTSR